MTDCLDLGVLDAPVLVYGGTYSNLQAPRALLAQADAMGIPPSHRINTGDVVAYCADPAVVTDLVMAQGGHVVRGNCEESFGQEQDGCGCGFEEGSACDLASRDWIAHANAELRPEQRTFMAACPGQIRFSLSGLTFAAIHGGFSAINRFVFPTDELAVAEELAQTDADCVLAGHSGIPFHLQQRAQHWINAGVIGMPFNDARTATGFVVLSPSPEGVDLQFHRLSSDHQAAADRMAAAGLPDGYRKTLISGFWPNMDVMPQPMRARRGKPLHLGGKLIRNTVSRAA